MEVQLNYRRNMRGIRKCRYCGIFNGYRATYCKNITCQMQLRDDQNPDRKVSPLLSACAIQLLPESAHLYSVWARAGKRNFIQTTVNRKGEIATLSIPSRSASAGVNADEIKDIVQLLSSCKTFATALPLHREAIDSLAVAETERNALWERQTKTSGPFVQRMGEDIFAVGTPSLDGMCHVIARKKNQIYSKLYCDCVPVEKRKVCPELCWHVLAVVAAILSTPEHTEEQWNELLKRFLAQSVAADEHIEPTFEFIDESVPSVSTEILDEQLALDGECIETIDCILNPTLMELFSDDSGLPSGLISLDEPLNMPTEVPVLQLTAEPDTRINTPTLIDSLRHSGDVIATGNAQSLHLMDCQIELMDEFDLTDRIDFCPSDIECDDSMLTLPANLFNNLPTQLEPSEDETKEKLVEVTAKESTLEQYGLVEKIKLTRGSYSVRKLMKALESNGIIFNRVPGTANASGPPSSTVPGYEATVCNLSFTRWLESVIEQLNGIIDFNREGKPEPQTFRIHEDFFRCLRSRFSVGHSLRQPEQWMPPEGIDATHAGFRQRGMLFRFSHHKSLLHVFRTDRLELSFEKSFMRSPDGTHFVANELPVHFPASLDLADDPWSFGASPIRAHSYSTYIKLGRYKHEPDPNRVYHFSLEWIGNVLPRSGFGDLTIQFEYGHRINNQYVLPPGAFVMTKHENL